MSAYVSLNVREYQLRVVPYSVDTRRVSDLAEVAHDVDALEYLVVLVAPQAAVHLDLAVLDIEHRIEIQVALIVQELEVFR